MPFLTDSVCPAQALSWVVVSIDERSPARRALIALNRRHYKGPVLDIENSAGTWELNILFAYDARGAGRGKDVVFFESRQRHADVQRPLSRLRS
jgi:hypothetical protein